MSVQKVQSSQSRSKSKVYFQSLPSGEGNITFSINRSDLIAVNANVQINFSMQPHDCDDQHTCLRSKL